MADSPISGLTAGTVAAGDDIVFVQSGVTKTDTAQGLIDLVSGSNLGNADLTVDSTGTRFLRTGGNLLTDIVDIQTNSGDSMQKWSGDRSVIMNTTGMVENHVFNGSGASVKTFSADMDGSTNKISFVFTNSNFGGGGSVQALVKLSPEGNNDLGLIMDKGRMLLSSQTLGGTLPNLDVSGGKDSIGIGLLAQNNHKFWVHNSGAKTNLAKFTSSDSIVRLGLTDVGAMNLELTSLNINGFVGQTETVSFGGGGSGDIATMTFEDGLYVSKTLVP